MLCSGRKTFEMSMHMTVLPLIAKLMNAAYMCSLSFSQLRHFLKVTPALSTMKDVSNTLVCKHCIRNTQIWLQIWKNE